MSVIPKIKFKYPVAMQWIIPKTRLEELIAKPGECLLSSAFEANNLPNVQYRMGIYPDHPDRKGETWIYFDLRCDGNIKIEADFSISVESANFHRKLNHLFEQSQAYGAKCCKTEELLDLEKGFVFDEKMILKMDGTLIVEREVPQKYLPFNGHADALCLGLWNQEESKDFTFVAEGKEIIAHKNVLAARSPVFARMFESDMKESEENKVVIKDFPFHIVQAAIKLCYHDSLVSYIPLDDKIQLLQFFDKYDIKPHKDNLESYLITVVNVLTVCRLTNASLLSNARKLELKCTEYLQECLHERKPISDFDTLDKDFAMNLLKNAFYPVSG